MTRAYLRLDPGYDERKESYPDGPYAALIACFCQAELQPERGRFRNERYLRALLGRRGRHVGYLIDHGDLLRLDDGRIYVVGWDEWQEGDWKVGERVERIRNRRRKDGTVDVTPDVTVDVTALRLSAGGGAGEAVSAGVSGSSDGSPKPQAVGGMTRIGAVLPALKEQPTAATTRLTKAQLDAWADFGPEWDAFKQAWFRKGLHFPPQGTPHDDDETNPSPRAMLYGILDARPTDLPKWVAEAPGRTQRDVIAYVLDQWHALRDSVART